jgi:hypothetical protein
MDSKIRFIPHAGEHDAIDHDWVKRLQVIHGILRYICDNTRPDISVSLGTASHAVARPMDGAAIFEHHLRILRNLRDTAGLNQVIGTSQSTFEIFAFADASHVTDHDSKGRLGYVIFFFS